MKNLFGLKKETIGNIIKGIRNLFRLKKENEAINDRIIRDIRNVFELENGEKIYYKPINVGNFYNINFIEYESDGDRKKTLSIEEYFNKIRPYLKDITNIFKRSDIWKIHD